MINFEVKRVTLVVTSLTSTFLIFTPLEAWIDHFFDFHLDLDRIQRDNRKDGGYEKDGAVYDHEAFYDWQNSQKDSDHRDSDRGANFNTPDRDRG